MISVLTVGALFVPILLYLVLLGSYDAFSLARWRMLADTFAWGIASALITFACVHIFRFLAGHAWTEWWVSPLLEETLKVIPLIILIFRGKVVFFAETMIYGQMIGGGFALMENLLFYIVSPDMALGTALVRGFGTSMLHMGCTALFASGLLVSSNAQKPNMTLLIAFYISPVLIHGVYNQHYLDPVVQLVIVVIGFFVIFMIMSHWNVKIMGKWLEQGLSDNIKLLTTLKQGKLLETPAGTYLQSIKEKFDPLVFFDMVTYVSLYLELLIDAKSRIMLKESSISLPLSKHEKRERDAKFKELKTLHSRIPKMGIHLLQPIVHTDQKDIWALS